MRRALLFVACAAGCIDVDATYAHVCEVNGFSCDGGEPGVEDGGITPPPPGKVRVVVTAVGGASGEVEWLEGAQRCSTTCDFTVGDAGATLRANPGDVSGLSAWSGACSARERTCHAAPGTAVGAAFSPANLAFVTAAALPLGTLMSTDGGLTAGERVDALCMGEAGDAGLPGTYRAWFSHATNVALPARGASEVFATASGWARVDGRAMATSRAELFAGRVVHPLRFDARGTLLSGTVTIATGTAADGTPVAMGDCDSWSRTSSVNYAYSAPSRAGPEWTQAGTRMCSDVSRFYCLGIDHDTAVFPQLRSGSKVFVSVGRVTETNTGLAVPADALCAAEAADAGLSGAFAAYLTSRDAGQTGVKDWVRVDAVPLYPGPAPLSGPLLAPIDVTAWGGVSAQSETFTSSSPSCDADLGKVHDVQQWNRIASSSNCGAARMRAVYCFER
ncbi:MAG: hypothetical protein IPJ65_12215 [Archangiaceae bacterium]|nr:hypothetical protein [Archangiaceae bacterium]